MYTYINLIGNNIYTSKYTNGKKVYEKDNRFQPYFFLKTRKESKYKSFPKNENVDKINCLNINDFSNALRTYPKNFVVGNIGRELPIVEKIREDDLAHDFDAAKIKVLFYDIEVWSEKGFPKPEHVEHPVVSISGLDRSNGNIFLWALTDEFQAIDWFVEKYPEFEDAKTLREVEKLIPIAKTSYLEKYNKKKEEVEETIRNKMKEFREIISKKHRAVGEEIPEEEEHIEFYVEKDKEFLKNIEKKIELWLEVDENYRRASTMTIKSFQFEEELLSDFFSFVSQNEYDAIVGWNSDFFDDPYILNRGIKLLGNKESKKISPFQYLKKKELEKLDGSKLNSYEIVGISQVDYLQLDKKYTQNKRDSYKLEDVSQSVAGIGKIQYSGDLRKLWLEDKKKYCIYNIGDVECLEVIDKNLGYIDLMFSIAHYTGSSPQKFAGTTAVWAAHLFNRLLDQNFVIPSSGSGVSEGQIVGAFVYEPQLGRKEWILSEDLTSLYPSLIRFANMSPETILHSEKQDINAIDKFVDGTFDFEPWKKQKKIITPFGTVFDGRKEGFIPALIAELFEQRKGHKDEAAHYKNLAKEESDPIKKRELLINANNLNNIQLAEKILLNSFYGALQVKSFPLFDKDMAEAITTMGQVANMYTATRVNKYINTITKQDQETNNIIAGDTDSWLLHATPVVNMIPEERREKMSDNDIVDFIDRFEQKKLSPFIKKTYDNMYDMIGGFVNTMNMDREIIGKGAFWKAKKRYAISVFDNEGYRYPEPKMKIMGMQTARSDTPAKLKQYMVKYIKRIVWNLDLKNYSDKIKDIFNDMNPEDYAIPKTANGIKDYYELKTDTYATYRKGTPIQVKAAIHYNNIVQKLDLTDKYPLFNVGDKVKILKLKDNNKYFISTIAIQDKLPEEFELDDYIDIDAQYYSTIGKFFEDLGECVGRKDELYKEHSFELF